MEGEGVKIRAVKRGGRGRKKGEMKGEGEGEAGGGVKVVRYVSSGLSPQVQK